MGSFSKTLVYRQGFLYLHYKNGDKCEKKPEQKTETLISFICDPYAKSETKPTLELTNECTHFVTWNTSLACEAEVILSINCNSLIIRVVPDLQLLPSGRVCISDTTQSLVL